MNNKSLEITKYFRSAVAAQANMGIDFKDDYFTEVNPEQVVQGKIDPLVCKNIFKEADKNGFDNATELTKKSLVNVIICAKTVKTVYEANEEVQDEIDKLTGIYYLNYS